MLKYKHFARINDKGKLVLSNPDAFKSEIEKYPDRNVYLIVSEERPTRSNNQNRYYWSVIVGGLSEELGYTVEEMHEILKYKFLPKKDIDLLGEQIKIGSSAKLDTLEFEKYQEDIREWASIQLGINLPEPNQVEFLEGK